MFGAAHSSSLGKSGTMVGAAAAPGDDVGMNARLSGKCSRIMLTMLSLASTASSAERPRSGAARVRATPLENGLAVCSPVELSARFVAMTGLPRDGDVRLEEAA